MTTKLVRWQLEQLGDNYTSTCVKICLAYGVNLGDQVYILVTECVCSLSFIIAYLYSLLLLLIVGTSVLMCCSGYWHVGNWLLGWLLECVAIVVWHTCT